MEMTEKELYDIRYKATEDYELGYENKYSPVYPQGSLYGPETVLGLFDEIDRLRAELAEYKAKVERVEKMIEDSELVHKLDPNPVDRSWINCTRMALDGE